MNLPSNFVEVLDKKLLENYRKQMKDLMVNNVQTQKEVLEQQRIENVENRKPAVLTVCDSIIITR